MNCASALIPAFNEARLDRARSSPACAASSSHVLVVDDGSTDATAERARAAGAEVLRSSANRGQGARGPRRAGARARRRLHARPAARRRHAAPARAKRRACSTRPQRTGADVVIGERQFRREEMPASRYHANRIGSRALSWFVGVPVRDTQCGFRVFRVEALRDLPLRATRLRDRNRDAHQSPAARRRGWPACR